MDSHAKSYFCISRGFILILVVILTATIPSLILNSFILPLYIIHLAKQYKSSGKIHSAAHAISWAHNLAGYVDPCDSVLVKNIKEGQSEKHQNLWPKKNLLRQNIWRPLVSTFGKDDNSYNLRTLCMCFF